MVGVCARPGLDLGQAGNERETRGLVVEVLRVEHLVAGQPELGFGSDRVESDHGVRRTVGVQTAVGVGEHVEFELANTELLELVGQRSVRVLDALRQLR